MLIILVHELHFEKHCNFPKINLLRKKGKPLLAGMSPFLGTTQNWCAWVTVFLVIDQEFGIWNPGSFFFIDLAVLPIFLNSLKTECQAMDCSLPHQSDIKLKQVSYGTLFPTEYPAFS